MCLSSCWQLWVVSTRALQLDSSSQLCHYLFVHNIYLYISVVFPSAAAECCQSVIMYAHNAIALLLQMPLMHVSLGHMLYWCSNFHFTLLASNGVLSKWAIQVLSTWSFSCVRLAAVTQSAPKHTLCGICNSHNSALACMQACSHSRYCMAFATPCILSCHCVLLSSVSQSSYCVLIHR